MGRPKKSLPHPVEPEDKSQEAPDEETVRELETEPPAPDPGPIPAGAVSQTDAARDAIDAGHEKPAEAVKYIKDKFGIDMNPQYFSAIKSRLGKGAAKRDEPARRGRKPREAAPVGRKPLVESYVAPPEKPRAANGETDLLAAMEAMKPLVAALGADKVKRIADLLG